MAVASAGPATGFQFNTIGKEPALLNRLQSVDPDFSLSDVESPPSPPPLAASDPENSSVSFGRLAALVESESSPSQNQVSTSSMAPAMGLNTASASSAPVVSRSIFDIDPAVFRMPSQSAATSASTSATGSTSTNAATTTGFYYRGQPPNLPGPRASENRQTSPGAASSSLPPVSTFAFSFPAPGTVTASSHSQPPECTPGHTLSRPPPERPIATQPQPAQPSQLPLAHTSAQMVVSPQIPAAAAGPSTDMVRIHEDLRAARLELEDVQRTRARVVEEYSEFAHRHAETVYALDRERYQMERLVATTNEWFEKAERMHARRERLLDLEREGLDRAQRALEERELAMRKKMKKAEMEGVERERQEREEADEKMRREVEAVETERLQRDSDERARVQAAEEERERRLVEERKTVEQRVRAEAEEQDQLAAAAEKHRCEEEEQAHVEQMVREEKEREEAIKRAARALAEQNERQQRATEFAVRTAATSIPQQATFPGSGGILKDSAPNASTPLLDPNSPILKPRSKAHTPLLGPASQSITSPGSKSGVAFSQLSSQTPTLQVRQVRQPISPAPTANTTAGAVVVTGVRVGNEATVSLCPPRNSTVEISTSRPINAGDIPAHVDGSEGSQRSQIDREDQLRAKLKEKKTSRTVESTCSPQSESTAGALESSIHASRQDVSTAHLPPDGASLQKEVVPLTASPRATSASTVGPAEEIKPAPRPARTPATEQPLYAAAASTGASPPASQPVPKSQSNNVNKKGSVSIVKHEPSQSPIIEAQPVVPTRVQTPAMMTAAVRSPVSTNQRHAAPPSDRGLPLKPAVTVLPSQHKTKTPTTKLHEQARTNTSGDRSTRITVNAQAVTDLPPSRHASAQGGQPSPAPAARSSAGASGNLEPFASRIGPFASDYSTAHTDDDAWMPRVLDHDPYGQGDTRSATPPDARREYDTRLSLAGRGE